MKKILMGLILSGVAAFSVSAYAVDSTPNDTDSIFSAASGEQISAMSNREMASTQGATMHRPLPMDPNTEKMLLCHIKTRNSNPQFRQWAFALCMNTRKN